MKDNLTNIYEDHYLRKELYSLWRSDDQLFDFIQEVCLDGLWFWDLDKPENEWMNPVFWKTLGYNPDDMPHTPSVWQEIINADDLKLAIDNFNKHLANENHPYDQIVRYRHRDGHIVWIRCKGKALRDKNGKPIRMLGIHTEITSFKNNEFRYKSLIDGTNVGTWEWNVQTGATVFNERWAEIVGYSLAELSPISIDTWLKLAHPDDLPESGKRLNACFEKKQDFYEFEARMKHKDGHWVWVYDRGKVFEWTADGKPFRMYGTHQDITPRKLKEEELRTFLSITEEQNNRLKNFAHIVSHNLRSHSRGISGMIDLLLLENPTLANNEMVSLLSSGAKSLNQTVEDLTEVVNVNLTAEKLRTIHLHSFVEKNIKSLSGLILKSGIKIIHEIPDNAQVKGVHAYIDSIILNMITNAIKYKSNDRGSYLKIYCKEDTATLALIFEDNGLGIDLKKHGDKIFGMYKTFHVHDDSRGIGLFITKNQVESMGGEITVDSEVDKGTTFKITLNK